MDDCDFGGSLAGVRCTVWSGKPGTPDSEDGVAVIVGWSFTLSV